MNALENTVVDNLTPSEFYLSRNFPDPFREKTTIKYCIAYKTRVRLEVLNYEGKLIKKILDDEKDAGTYELIWKAGDLPCGIYLYRLKAGSFVEIKKMELVK